jgi:FAD/FMN-containing dehydrogenase
VGGRLSGVPAPFRNWSGSLTFTPGDFAEPASERQLIELVRRAADRRTPIRAVGAGHSSSSLVATDGLLLSLRRLTGMLSHDRAAHEAVIRPGTTIEAMNRALWRVGLAVPNTGDVDVQTIGGAIATGTHGSGRRLGNLATMLVGGRLVDGRGEVVDFSAEHDPELVCAARVSLGALGILTRLRLALVPAYELRRREWCTTVDGCLAHLDELLERHRNVDFYWYPRSDEVKLRIGDRLEEADAAAPPGARLVKDECGPGGEIRPRTRELRFEEMEYALPAEAGPACFLEVRRQVVERHRKEVAWRVLYRVVAPDDAYLSTTHGRPTATISLHHNAGLPFEQYFDDVEPIFRAHGGRPHWAKKHNLTAAELRPLYPRWGDFARLRAHHDPAGLFLSPALRELLGVA